jgi:hypothetical protein
MNVARLELDFLRRGRRAGWASWTLLALALAFALDVGRSWQALRTEVARKETQLAARAGDRPRGDLIRISNRPPREGELLSARDTLRRLSLPWNALFGALEAAQTEGTWLLSIEPDVQNGTVTLSGEARDYLAALSYVANLQRQKALAGVHLVKHETKQNEQQRPLAFTIAASWRERP